MKSYLALVCVGIALVALLFVPPTAAQACPATASIIAPQAVYAAPLQVQAYTYAAPLQVQALNVQPYVQQQVVQQVVQPYAYSQAVVVQPVRVQRQRVVVQQQRVQKVVVQQQVVHQPRVQKQVIRTRSR